MTEHVQEMTNRLREYLESDSTIPKYQADLLLQINQVIQALGYDWGTIPPDAWEKVYMNVGTLSVQKLHSVQHVVKNYYEWLINSHYVSRKQNTYRTPDYRRVFANEISYVYPESLEHLFEMYDIMASAIRRRIQRDIDMNKTLLGLIWMGFDLEAIAALKASDIEFFNSDGMNLFVSSEASEVMYGQIRSESRLIRFANQDMSSLLYSFWQESMNRDIPEEETRFLFYNMTNATPLIPNNMNVRLFRVIGKINEACSMDITIRSIRKAGMFDRLYRYWMIHNLSWYATPQNIDEFYRQSGLVKPEYISPRNAEFQQFVEFVRLFHPDSIR